MRSGLVGQKRTQSDTVMIAPWRNLNSKGKMLTGAAIINLIVAVYIGVQGSMIAIFSVLVAAWCGSWTYHGNYQHKDAKDINEGREE